MFVRTSALVLAIAASAAIAFPSDTPTAVSASQCDTGAQQCCNQTVDASSGTQELLGLLSILTDPVEGLVGFGCSPISAIGLGSGAVCEQQPVCCSNIYENGLINLGCSPLDLNL